MLQRNFMDLLKAKWAEGKFVCIGLDTDLRKILPEEVKKSADRSIVDVWATIFEYNKAIVSATADVVCAYKLQSSFYEATKPDGLQAMKDTVEFIQRVFPSVPVICDAKRADIGSTNEGYVRAVFAIDRFDALTLHPYLGREALQPFLKMQNKGFFILCRTSNPGAGEFQDLDCGGKLLYQIVAEHISSEWNVLGNCGVVVGATYPEELALVRTIIGEDMPILIPGIGAQGGDIKATVKAGVNRHGRGIIINSSRGIIFAKQREPVRYGSMSFSRAAHMETMKLHATISKVLYK